MVVRLPDHAPYRIADRVTASRTCFRAGAEVEADKTGTLGAVVPPATKGNVSTKSSSKTQGTAVEPGKEGLFWWSLFDLGKLSRQKVSKKLAVGGELDR
jgi:hypothetical protein